MTNECTPGKDPLQELIPAQMQNNSASYYIANVLREAIYRGILLEGEALHQSQLAERLNVSPIPLREALRLLEMEGLVDFHGRRGATVTKLTLEEAREIYEMLTALEVSVLRIALPSISDEVVAAAEALLDRMETEPDCMVWRELNIEFHNTLHEPADRPLTLDMIARLRQQIDRYVRLHLESMREESQQQHRKILEAVRAGDLEAATAALEFHLKNTSRDLQTHMRVRD
ncbi:MAG: GntR family transcriptional regulator [Synergistaceae bacterium]|jgi:DNA-binding GntR family transcriptional regulator|nr:GntR family transcriptional regulator [Synergistaceae bacterium]